MNDRQNFNDIRSIRFIKQYKLKIPSHDDRKIYNMKGEEEILKQPKKKRQINYEETKQIGRKKKHGKVIMK